MPIDRMHNRVDVAATGRLAHLTLSGFACLVGCFLAQRQSLLADETPAADWHLDVLQRFQVKPDADSVLKFVNTFRTDSVTQQQVAKLIEQLGHEDFAVRERASKQLMQLNVRAESQLRTAAINSTDLEVAFRARQVLQRLDIWKNTDEQNTVLLAALVLLKRLKPQHATEPVLDLIRYLDDSYVRNSAYEVVWATASKSDAELFRRYSHIGPSTIQAAAIVGLELALEEDAVVEIEPFLSNTNSRLRLAAARALINHRPKLAVDTLARLLDDRDPDVQVHAMTLFGLATGKRFDFDDRFPQFTQWRQEWVSHRHTLPLRVPLGEERLDATPQRTLFFETFDNEVATIGEKYGVFQFENTLKEGGASVARNMLRFSGQFRVPGADGDQRLFLTAPAVLGQREFPKEFRIRTRMGGANGNPGTWHVGVSVGNLRILFHPGLKGGAFRAERIDTRQALMLNTDLGFTPRTGVTHDVQINVRVANGHAVYFTVVVTDGTNPKARFERTFLASKTAVGRINRIGLERSGRTGGTAYFGRLMVTFGRGRIAG